MSDKILFAATMMTCMVAIMTDSAMLYIVFAAMALCGILKWTCK